MTFKMEKWQIQMINSITMTHPNYDRTEAIDLANQWNNTDEKFTLIIDYFGMSANDIRVDYWVDKIEKKKKKILNQEK